MATQQDSLRTLSQEEIGYKDIQLFKDKTLGIGSYGRVCQAKCDDLLCAAKIIHPTLFDPVAHERVERKKQHRLPFTRFVQECEFMKVIMHPNIVQCLGIAQDPDTHLPVLLMELMDSSLTGFLENSQVPVPYYTQVNFAHDISMALSYLHLNGIIHRDLSSNNVLLIRNIRAKVTDFGMAKLELNSRRLREQELGASFTKCPGTQVYMPPESLKEKPTYTEKIDSFSFGAILIQILTRKFPDPDEQLKPVSPDGEKLVRVAEIKRRKNHIELVGPKHPLLPISLDCLNDKEAKRPSARELCERLEALKDTPEYIRSVREHDTPKVMVKGDDEQKGSVERDEAKPISIGREETKMNGRSSTEEMERVLQEKERELQRTKEELESNEQLLSEFQDRILELERQLTNRDQPPTPPTASKQPSNVKSDVPSTPSKPSSNVKGNIPSTASKQPSNVKNAQSPKMRQHRVQSVPLELFKANGKGQSRTNITLNWKPAQNAPMPMIRGTTATSENIVYFNPNDSQKVFSYNSTCGTWSQLPDCPYKDASIATVSNLLTAIGGRDEKTGEHTDKIFTYDESKGWVEILPHMPTKRRNAIAVSAGSALIVAGGLPHGGGAPIRTVEVLNTETKQWSTAASLPEQVHSGSVAYSNDHIYIAGYLPATKRVLKCSLNALLQSCHPKFQGTMPPKLEEEDVWNEIAELPYRYATCVIVKGRLTAISKHIVLLYSPLKDNWEVISHTVAERESCLAAVLPNNEIMIVGGTEGGPYSRKDTVEIATVTF